MFSRRTKDLVGIDVGSSSIKIAQLREQKGGFQLLSLGLLPISADAIVDNSIMDSGAIVSAIRNLAESHKVKTKNVATSVSGHSVIIRKIQLPIMTEEEMEASIQWEAEQYIPFEVSEVNIDFQILGPDSKDPSQMNVVLVAAKKDFVNDYVAVFQEAGFNPIVMDVDCFAVENAYEANYDAGEEDIIALINMGASAMNVNVLKEGVSVFTRVIQVGGNMFNEELQKRLGLSGEDAEQVKLGAELEDVDPEAVLDVIEDAKANLIQEIQRSLDFYSATSADERVQKVYITGGVSRTATMQESLRERLEVPVELLDPFRMLNASEKDFDPEYLEAVAPLFSVAVGLGMRRLGDLPQRMAASLGPATHHESIDPGPDRTGCVEPVHAIDHPRPGLLHDVFSRVAIAGAQAQGEPQHARCDPIVQRPEVRFRATLCKPREQRLGAFAHRLTATKSGTITMMLDVGSPGSTTDAAPIAAASVRPMSAFVRYG
jgi:type IV pilus assembly protein PilM